MKNKSKLAQVKANDSVKAIEAQVSQLALLNERLDRSNEIAEKMLSLQQEVVAKNNKNEPRAISSEKVDKESLKLNQNSYKLSQEIKKQNESHLELLRESLGDKASKVSKNVGSGILSFGERMSGVKNTVKGMISNPLVTAGKLAGLSQNSILGGMIANSDAKQKYIHMEQTYGKSTKSKSELGKEYNTLRKLGKIRERQEDEIHSAQAAGYDTKGTKAERALNNTISAMKNTGTSLMQSPGKMFSKVEPLKVKESTSSNKVEPTKDVNKSEAAQEEATNEANDLVKEQTTLLEKILSVLSGKSDNKKIEPTKTESGKSGGFLDSIMDYIGGGFMSVIKKLFNPRMLFKAISKVFVPAMIIGSLFSGIMDGWEEFKKSGSIIEALKAGFGGILEFLTFGLIDKDAIESFTNWISEPVGEFVDSIGEIFNDIGSFFSDLKDKFLNMVAGIGIPAFEIDIPLIGKKKFGPYYPFKDAATTPTQADSNSTQPVKPPDTPNVESQTKVVAPVEVSKVQRAADAKGEQEYFEAVKSGDMELAAKTAETLGYVPKSPNTTPKIQPPTTSKIVNEKSTEVENAKDKSSGATSNVAVVNNSPTQVNNNTVQMRKDIIKGDRSSASVGRNQPSPPR